MVKIYMVMKKTAIAFAAFLLIISSLCAELKIKPEHHISNRGSGLCSWAALGTLGRTHGYKQLENIINEKDKAVKHEGLIKELEKRKVKFRSYDAKKTEWWYHVWYQKEDEKSEIIGSYLTKKEASKAIKGNQKLGSYWIARDYYWKTGFLLEAIKKDLGAAVTIQVGNDTPHMLVIVGLDEKQVRLVDSNYEPGKIREMPLHLFLKYWVGFAIVIDKP